MQILVPNTSKPRSRKGSKPRLSREGEGVWTAGEHERFLQALELYPHGPWKFVAAFIGTRTTRQAMTHAQKYHQKLERRRRGLRTARSNQATGQAPLPAGSQASFRFEERVTVDSVEIGATSRVNGDWRAVKPIPLDTAPVALQTPLTEMSWVDECLSFFVDNFS